MAKHGGRTFDSRDALTLPRGGYASCPTSGALLPPLVVTFWRGQHWTSPFLGVWDTSCRSLDLPPLRSSLSQYCIVIGWLLVNTHWQMATHVWINSKWGYTSNNNFNYMILVPDLMWYCNTHQDMLLSTNSEMCTNIGSPPAAGWIKPWPFSRQKLFTLPKWTGPACALCDLLVNFNLIQCNSTAAVVANF